MTRFRLVLRSLQFHFRSNLGALIGAAISTAILVGALVIAALAAVLYFGIPHVQRSLNTVSTDDAYVNGHVTFVAARVPGQVDFDGVLVDQMNSIENLIGSSNADTLVGDGGANRLTGGGGADSLWGKGGADVFVYRAYSDSNLVTGYDTIADFITGTSKLDLTALGTDASHVLIQSDAQSTSLYVERTPGFFDPSTDLAISLVGPHAIAMGDILF